MHKFFTVMFSLTVMGLCSAKEVELYIGTAGAEGSLAYMCTFDQDTGELGTPKRVSGMDDARIVQVHQGLLLASVTRSKTPGQKRGPQEGVISSLVLDAAESTGPSQQFGPLGLCALDVFDGINGKYVAAASFPEGNVVTYPLRKDGSLGEMCFKIQHETLPPKTAGEKERAPKAHDFKVTPDGKCGLVADLGLCQVIMYRLNPEDGSLKTIGALSIDDAGPRHITFHPTLPIAYVVNQGGGSVVAFSYDTQSGAMKALKQVPTLPADYVEKNACATIQIHPEGKFLYASNRGHDSLAMFTVDEEGLPSSIGQISSGGEVPRCFVISPNGKWIIVTNQKTSNMRVFKIDQRSGNLTQTQQVREIDTPISIVLRME